MPHSTKQATSACMARQHPQGANLASGRNEPCSKPSMCSVLSPLSVIPIRFASWNGLDMLGIDQVACDTSLLQQVINRNPVHAGGLHCDARDAAGEQPGQEGVQ